MRDEHLATAGNTWITADEETQSQPSATADVTEAPGPGPFLPPAPGGAGWLSAATTQVIRRDRRGLRAPGAGPADTHVMVSIMSRPISTQQCAWSALGWVRPDTQ